MSGSTESSATDVDVGADTDVPPKLSALFLIRFDKKVGYTIAWKRSDVDVDLDNNVEFKALPSGLHTLDEDLVYFVHDDYAGLSAFAKGDASAEDRNAQFVSVGILVSRAYGRLGRSWLLAARLQRLAVALADDVEATAVLEEFWEEQKGGAVQNISPAGSPKDAASKGKQRHSRARALSAITTMVPSGRGLPDFHPALSMLKYVDLLGPLAFRLQQAALLRKRILFVGGPPVRTVCEFVYNLSVLSSIPPHAAELLSPDTEPLLRLPALFSIGVHDISYLEQLQKRKANGSSGPDEELPAQGWVACTTDEIITSKKSLYDIVVEIPTTYDAPPTKRKWPTMKNSDGAQIKASQRDLRRWQMLQRELRRHQHPVGDIDDDDDDDEQPDSDTAALLSRKKSADSDHDAHLHLYDDTVVEPTTWTQLAYTGFLWWASAGYTSSPSPSDLAHDLSLIGDLSDYASSLPTAIIAYFHRSTAELIRNLNALVERSDDDEENEYDEDMLVLDGEDVGRLGLDMWSEADRAFLSEFAAMWMGRGVEVRGRRIECCGVGVPVF